MNRRLFRPLDGPPEPSYDAVIVGAGVGGLVTGNLLAREGLKVLLVEQHYMVGGYCSTFQRRRYTFDAATHFYPLLGNTETLTGKLLADLGIETRWVKMDPVDTFHLPDGTRFTVPADFEAYLAKLKAEFPEEGAALDGFFADVHQAYLFGLLHYFRGRPLEQVGRLAEYRRLTVKEVLDRGFRSPKLKLLLTADCPHWGSPPGRTSFVFDSMLRLSYFLGNYYPRGGSQAFADELARRFVEQGGHLLLATSARRVLVEDGRATGVELQVESGRLLRSYAGGVVRAGVVISNADLIETCERLLGPRHVPASTLERLRRLRPTFPCWLTHLGLKGVPAAALEEAQGYYWDSWDFECVGRGALKFKLFAPTLYEPGMAPDGEQVLIVQKVLEVDYDGISDWDRHKQEMEAFIFSELERLLPGIGGKIVVRASATARTSFRYTRNLRGAMLGWEMSPDQLGPDRPPQDLGVANLHCVGHWTQPGGGVTPVIVSAQQVAAKVLRSGGGLIAARSEDEFPYLKNHGETGSREARIRGVSETVS